MRLHPEHLVVLSLLAGIVAYLVGHFSSVRWLRLVGGGMVGLYLLFTVVALVVLAIDNARRDKP